MTSAGEWWTGLALRWFVAIVAVAALGSYAWLYTRPDREQPVHSDGYSYYVYVPSVVVYNDPTLEALGRDWFGGEYPDFTAIRRWPATGRLLNPHPMGTALLMAPFVVVAHALTLWSNLPPDGFSLYYQHAAALAGLFYMLAGLALLRRLLLREFQPGVVLATLITITWGTNLFHYGTFDSSFSHAFSFFLICALVELTDAWWRQPRIALSALTGMIAGLILLCRHTNAIFLLVVPLYGLQPGSDDWLRRRAVVLWQRRTALVLMAVVAALVFAPQAALYRYATGRWIASPYGALEAGFHFLKPHLAGVLVGTQKGLLFWSPALLLAIVGFFAPHPFARRLLVPTILAFAIDVYLVASWSDWQFGASYGHRAFVDGYALLAIFIAAVYAWAGARRPSLAIVSSFAVISVALSVAQMIQYWNRILPMANTTWDQYREIFMRFQ